MPTTSLVVDARGDIEIMEIAFWVFTGAIVVFAAVVIAIRGLWEFDKEMHKDPGNAIVRVGAGCFLSGCLIGWGFGLLFYLLLWG